MCIRDSIQASCGIVQCSDRRYKTNITPLPNTLENLAQLQGVFYNWRIDEYPEMAFSERKQIGVIAQELEAIYPELVTTDDSGYKTVDYPKLAPILLNGINELQVLVANLTEQNEALKAEVTTIKAMVEEQAGK